MELIVLKDDLVPCAQNKPIENIHCCDIRNGYNQAIYDVIIYSDRDMGVFKVLKYKNAIGFENEVIDFKYITDFIG